MYSEIVSIHDVGRLRKLIDPDSKHFTDEQFSKILETCSGMIDRAVVKCFLGIEHKAKVNNDSNTVLWARTQLGRFEAGLIQV